MTHVETPFESKASVFLYCYKRRWDSYGTVTKIPHIALKLNYPYKVPALNSDFQKRRTISHLLKHFAVNTKL